MGNLNVTRSQLTSLPPGVWSQHPPPPIDQTRSQHLPPSPLGPDQVTDTSHPDQTRLHNLRPPGSDQWSQHLPPVWTRPGYNTPPSPGLYTCGRYASYLECISCLNKVRSIKAERTLPRWRKHSCCTGFQDFKVSRETSCKKYHEPHCVNSPLTLILLQWTIFCDITYRILCNVVEKSTTCGYLVVHITRITWKEKKPHLMPQAKFRPTNNHLVFMLHLWLKAKEKMFFSFLVLHLLNDMWQGVDHVFSSPKPLMTRFLRLDFQNGSVISWLKLEMVVAHLCTIHVYLCSQYLRKNMVFIYQYTSLLPPPLTNQILELSGYHNIWLKEFLFQIKNIAVFNTQIQELVFG